MSGQQQRNPSTMSSSIVQLKNIIRLALSSICYVRNLFPEHCFEERVYAGLSIRGLLPEAKEAADICKWLEKGAFDALSKKYLKTMMFGVFSNETSEPMESYFFDVTYNESTVGLTLSKNGEAMFTETETSRSAMQSQIVILLRVIMTLASTMGDLPKDHHLGIALEYTNRAPDDYEPEYFRPVTDRDNLAFPVRPFSMKLGQITNHFVGMQVHVKSIVDFMDKGRMPSHHSPANYPLFQTTNDSQVASSSSSLPSTARDSSNTINNNNYVPPSPSQSAEAKRSSLDSSSPPSSSSSSSSDSNKLPPPEWRIIPESQDSDEGMSPLLYSETPPSQKAAEKQDMFEKVKSLILKEGDPTKRFVRESFPDLTAEEISGIFDKLVVEGVLSKEKNGRFKLIEEQENEVISQIATEMLTEAYIYTLQRDTVSQAGLRTLGFSAESANATLEHMEELGIIEKATKKGKARSVIKSKRNDRILQDLKERSNLPEVTVESAGSNLSQALQPMNIQNSPTSKSAKNKPEDFVSPSKTYSKKRRGAPTDSPEQEEHDSPIPSSQIGRKSMVTKRIRRNEE